MAYGNTLQALLSKASPQVGAPPAAASLGMGQPPQMPGLPPPPTGLGAMPTGDPSTTKKAAADQAILALREVKGHYPQLATMLDATVDALKAAAQPAQPNGASAPAPPSGAGEPPTAPMESGSSGTM